MGETRIMNCVSIEKELRKGAPAGTWVKLGDGNLWCIPSLPLGDSCEEVLGKLEKVFELQKDRKEEKDPEEDETENKSAMKRMKELFKAGTDFVCALMQRNYPELTVEIINKSDLLTIQHLNLFILIAQGGSSLGEVIGDSLPGELKRTPRS